MRLPILVLAAILAASAAAAQPLSPESADTPHLNLPVSLDKIKEGLAQTPTLSLLTLDERPTFTVQVREWQRIEQLLATLDFKTTPPPAAGLYMAELQRQWFPSVDNPLTQPLAPFGQGQLVQLLVENLVGHYLGGRALNAVSSAERTHAETAARGEVQKAIGEYCAAQPDRGAGIQICSSSSAVR